MSDPGRARWSHRIACLILPAAIGLELAQVAPAAHADEPTAIGLGRYYSQPKGGLFSAGDMVPPEARNIGGELVGKAVPTNQWYSSVIFAFPSEPIHAHPMTYRTAESGFEIGLASKQVVPTDRGNNEIRYPHAAAITVTPAGAKFAGARLMRIADWLAQMQMTTAAGDTLQATVLHGSPFSYFETSAGEARFHLGQKADRIADPDQRVMAMRIGGKLYAIFAPTGATWEWPAADELIAHLPAGAHYFAIAGLPDDRAETIKEFAQVAYAFPTDTRVQWKYDEAGSFVRTTFTVSTVAKEGDNKQTFLGLYPHHWYGQKLEPRLTYSYDSVRGKIRLLRASEFSVERTYHGILPFWDGIRDTHGDESLRSLMGGDLAKSGRIFAQPGMGRGTYWTGKGLGALAQLMSVAEAEGDLGMRDELLKRLKERMESWFDGDHGTYFVQDRRIGSFLGYPQEYNSVRDMNDHHFHYGYWVMAAAHVALRDPDWASQQKWGGMVGKIVADIATPERGRADFPFLRNFDPYEGHSWASGNAAFSEGNNQESSSEAVNAWAGIILLGEATGDRALRDLGIYLYTSEIDSVQNYWFDLHKIVFAPEFGKPFASMVFGGKYAYNTWWTEEPRQILGINLLPMTPASLYLGADPEFVRRCVGALDAEKAAYSARGMSDGTPADIWQDVIAEYLALADAQAGNALWARGGTVERGETRSHAQHWLLSLREMGQPDFTVAANTPLYSVFRKADGARSYLAYNAGKTQIEVTFSDGKTLAVPPRKLVRAP